MDYGNNAKIPAGVVSSDKTTDKKEPMRDDNAMGMKDKTGSDKQFNTGRSESMCYTHDRKSCQ
jgi:hypothetical protein